METPQLPLSIESFSYRWLPNLKPATSLESAYNNSLDAFDINFDQSSPLEFIEMDPRMPPSKRFLIRNSLDFKFDFPISQSPLTTPILHADDLFSNGYIMPFFVDPLKAMQLQPNNNFQASTDSTTSSSFSSSSGGPKPVVSATKTRFRGCRRLFHKYLHFLRPLYRRIRSRHSSTALRRVESTTNIEDINVHNQVVKSCWVYSSQTSPRISVAYSVGDWRKSCDSESSIYEAVLHCKRSIGETN